MKTEIKIHSKQVFDQIPDSTVDDWSVLMCPSNSTPVNKIEESRSIINASGEFPLKRITGISLEKRIAKYEASILSENIISALDDVTKLMDLSNGGLNSKELKLLRIHSNGSTHFFRICSDPLINDTPKIIYARMESLLKILSRTANDATVMNKLFVRAGITADFLQHVRMKLADKLTEDQTYNTANAAEKERVAKWWKA